MTTPGPDHERYAQWDAAYVLGALSPAERREFETHHAECAVCTASVFELAAMPGLMSALPAPDAFDALAVDAETAAGIPSTVLGGLTQRVYRLRRRRRRMTTIVVGALAAAAAMGIVLPITLDAGPPIAVPVPSPTSTVQPAATPRVAVALSPVTPSPLSATVSLAAASWGTLIDMTCTYGTAGEARGAYATTGRYALYVTDAAGTTTQVSSWSAAPGSTVTTTGSIETPISGIRSVELRSLENDSVLLAHTLG